jgi:hypothetical protein
MGSCRATRHTPDYQAYLLRLWREGEGQAWRATLEDPHNGRRVSFASLAQLAAYLDQQTRPVAAAPPPEAGGLGGPPGPDAA